MDFQRHMHSLADNHMQTDLHSLLKQAHNRIALFLHSHRYLQLDVLLQSLQNRLNDYYKFTPAISKDFQAIRALNKLRKRQEITILHNQAVLSMKQSQIESAIDIRTVIVEELNNMIQGEQTRYGFLEEDDQKQRKNAMESIAYWKRELVKHYYFFAKLTYMHSSLEIALAALMKGLDLIKQSYQNQLKIAKDSLNIKEKGKRTHDESYSEKLCHFEQVEELFLLWQLREKVSHSKYLNIVSSNALTEIICSFCKEGNHKETYSSEFQTFDIDKMNELELPKIEDIISHAYTGKKETNQFQVNKVAHFLYLGLMSKIYADQNNQTQNEYQKLKNAKNVVFLHVIQAAIAHYYLKNSQNTQDILQQYRNIYKPKLINPKKTANLYNLIQIFGLTPQSLAEHDQTHQEVSIIQMNKKIVKNTKKHKSTQKRRSKSQKPKSKSKSKGKAVPSKAVKKQNQQKQKKKKVRQEYMMKRDVKNYTKVSENHLIKAINQNYRSFDRSLSKEKHQSPFRRAIRTETCINDKKIKQQGPSIKTEKVHRQKKLT